MILELKNKFFKLQLIIYKKDFEYFNLEFNKYIKIKIKTKIAKNILTINLIDIPNDNDELLHIQEDYDGIIEKYFLLDIKTNTIYIKKPKTIKWKRHIVTRIIRDIFKYNLILCGGVPIHAGLINVENLGISIVGNKKSGKTTTLLSLLSNKGIFICNDDLIIKINENGIFKRENLGYGSNRSISIRKDTIKNIEMLNGIYARKNPLNESFLSKKYLFLKPNELFQGSTKENSNIDIFIFPKFNSEIKNVKINTISKNNLKKKLIENIDDNRIKYFPNLFKKIFTYKDLKKEFINKIKIISENTIGIEIEQNINNIIKIEDIIKKYNSIKNGGNYLE